MKTLDRKAINRKEEKCLKIIKHTLKYGKFDAVQKMLDVGLDINYEYKINKYTGTKEGYDKTTLLVEMLKNEDYKACYFLMSKGADVNIAGRDGVTPLMHACSHGIFAKEGNLKMVKSLYDKGANLTAKNDDGANALNHCIGNNKLPVLKFMIKVYGELKEENTYIEDAFNLAKHSLYGEKSAKILKKAIKEKKIELSKMSKLREINGV